MDDLYTFLGVDKTASQEDIKKAFRNKAKSIHPDKTGNENPDMIKLNHAYDVLGDQESRKAYDTSGIEDTKSGFDAEVKNMMIVYFQGSMRDKKINRRNFILIIINFAKQQIKKLDSKLLESNAHLETIKEIKKGKYRDMKSRDTLRIALIGTISETEMEIYKIKYQKRLNEEVINILNSKYLDSDDEIEQQQFHSATTTTWR